MNSLEDQNKYADCMRITSTRFLIATLALSIVAISCGGGGGGDAMGGNSSTRLSDEEFCAKIVSLESETSSDDSSPQAMLDSLNLLRDLAKVAPNAELQAALETFTPLLEEMSKLDEDDPEAFSIIFAKLFDPKFINAGEVLDAYTTDVCGIEETAE